MSDPTVRLLRLLELLQEHAVWSGPDLAERLGVSVRGVRRDVDRLRELGYPVRSERGVGGGYQLVGGKAMPPLVLDDEEAVAVAVALSVAATGGVSGVGEASLRALAKLDQVVPPRLRERIAAIRETTVTLDAPGRPGASAEAGDLAALARAGRDHVQVRFAYTKPSGERDERRCEPYRLVATGRRWYLLAWDLDRDDWRLFRVDRVSDVHVTTFRFAPREAPDAAERVRSAMARDAYRHRARLRVRAPAEVVARRFPYASVEVTPIDEGSCEFVSGADDIDAMAAWIGHLDWEFEVLGPAELREALRARADRMRRAAGASA